MTTVTSDSARPDVDKELRPAGGRFEYGVSLEIEHCLQELAHLTQSELSAQEFYAALLDRALRLLPAVGGAVWQMSSGSADLIGANRFPQPLLDQKRPAASQNGKLNDHRPFFLPAYARSAEGYPSDYPHPWPLVVCSPTTDDHGSIVVEIALEPDVGTGVLAGAAQLVGVFGEIAADFHRRRELERLRLRESRLAQFADVVSRFHARLNPLAVAYAIANDGRQWIGCDRVSVLRLRHRRARALAVSAVDCVDRRSDQITALESLAAAVAASGELLQWHGGSLDNVPPQLAGALQTYLDRGHARQLAACLLRPAQIDSRSSASPPIGVLIAESFAVDQPFSLLDGRAEEVARAGGSALANALRYQAMPLRSLQERLSNVFERISHRPVAIALGVCAFGFSIALLAIVPADFSVPAEGTVQPQVRRHLFAPADGVVAEVRAEHGEQVANGDVLLRIRNPSFDLEQSRLSGELHTARTKLDAVRSTRSRPEDSPDSGDQDRLASEEEQLKRQVQGLENQLHVLGQMRGELEIVSPLDGIVLTWNTRQLLSDRPVKQGHTLLTVADPSSPWILELRVRDAQIGHVISSQRSGSAELPVTFLLASDPALTHRGILASLALATDVAEGESAADATVALPQALPAGVRAGSHVTARIHCGRRSIGYVWLHDLIDFVRTSLLF